jgi:hypothetical protein
VNIFWQANNTWTITNWLYILQSQHCLIVKYLFPSQHSQASNSTSQGSIAKSKLILCIVKWTSSCLQNLIFLVCPMFEFFLWYAKTSTPQNQIDVYSFIIQMLPRWPFSPFLLWDLLSLISFDLMVFLKFDSSPFKIQTIVTKKTMNKNKVVLEIVINWIDNYSIIMHNLPYEVLHFHFYFKCMKLQVSENQVTLTSLS